MHTTSITADGTYKLTQKGTVSSQGTVYIVANPDAATVTLGYLDSTGTFRAFVDGANPAADTLINHGKGVTLAASVSGTGVGTLVIEYGE